MNENQKNESELMDDDLGQPVSRSKVPWLIAAIALHTTDLPTRPETFVHVDAAHRGLGTASCGPDTLTRYLVRPGRHRWRWTLAPR